LHLLAAALITSFWWRAAQRLIYDLKAGQRGRDEDEDEDAAAGDEREASQNEQ